MDTDKDKIVIIDSDDELPWLATDGQPLMHVLINLISGLDSHRNTVLTNSHLSHILHVEYNICQPKNHPLEIDIYVNLIKKFLREWPLWDKFDNLVVELKQEKDINISRKVYEEFYENLKNYIKDILKQASAYVRDFVEQAIIFEKNPEADVIMEVECSRVQLNNLIFRLPEPKLKNTIFNICEKFPEQPATTYDLDAMLNSYGITILIYRDSIVYKHSIVHTLNHKIVNKKLPKTPFTKTDGWLEEKDGISKAISKVNIKLLKRHLEKMQINLKSHTQGNNGLYQAVFKIILEDLKHLPKTIAYPRYYRKVLNNYPYVRHFTTDVETNKAADKCDLHLEEVLTPMCEFYLHHIDLNLLEPCSLGNWITIECDLCQVNFSGDGIRKNFETHFMLHHSKEKDWYCTNCNVKISDTKLASNCWYHDCDVERQTKNV